MALLKPLDDYSSKLALHPLCKSLKHLDTDVLLRIA